MDGFAARAIEGTYAIMMGAFLRMQRAAIQMFSKHRGKERESLMRCGGADGEMLSLQHRTSGLPLLRRVKQVFLFFGCAAARRQRACHSYFHRRECHQRSWLPPEVPVRRRICVGEKDLPCL